MPMEYFDYQSVASEAGITPAQLAQIIERVRRDYSLDAMLCELHVLRACRAIRDGQVTVEQVLAEPVVA
jgi:hypothetical protein